MAAAVGVRGPAMEAPHASEQPPESLMFDLDLTAGGQAGATADYRPAGCELQRSLQVLATAQTHFEERLLRDVRAYKRMLLREEGEADTVVLATRLAAVGYRVTIRTALGGGAGQECFHNLHHEFLRVSEEHGGAQLIVDPRFREQFQISAGTPGYQDLLAGVPEEFVGTAGRLIPMVKLLCAQMQDAFAATGRTCPPWRRATSMISKWAPSKARDTEVASPSSSPDACYARGGGGRSLAGASPRGPLSRCNSGATASSCASSRASGSTAVQAKPLVRQAGFEPSLGGPSAGFRLHSTPLADAAQPQRRHSMPAAVAAGCKDAARSALLHSGSSHALKQGQAAGAAADWQEPRIRTVRMGGGERLK